MSEPISFFAKIHISQKNYDAFLKAKPVSPILNDNWISWWTAKEMHSKKQLTQEDLMSLENHYTNNQEVIERWIGDSEAYGDNFAFSNYDATNETWHFGIIFYSANYFDMLLCMAFVKNIETYKLVKDNDFAILYDYYWSGNEISALLTFNNNECIIDNAVQSKMDIKFELFEVAENYLNMLWNDNELEEKLI